MKKQAIVFAFFYFISVFVNAQQFILKGKITGQENGYIYMTYKNSDGKNIKDSCAIVNGSFQLSGSINEPTMCSLWGELKSNSIEDPNSTNFYLEPSTMFITVKKDGFKNAVVTGSKTEDENVMLMKMYEPIQKETKPLSEKYNIANDNLIDATRNKKDQVIIDSLEKIATNLHDRLNMYREQFSKIDFAFFADHPDSYVTAFQLRYYLTDLPLDSLQMYYDRMSEKVRASSYGKSLFTEIQKIRSGSPGSVAKNFNAKDINGKSLTLSEFKGKYVLLDFWASWCIPCRASNPHLKELYTKYKGKDFVIIGISDDDNDTTAWKKAVEKDGLQWLQILRGLNWDKLENGEENSNDISDAYGVHSIPVKILIDKNGVIIGRYGEGRDDELIMDKKLAEVLAQ